MPDEIKIAFIGLAGSVIVAALSLIGIIYQSNKSRKESNSRMNSFQADMSAGVKASIEVAQAITDTKLEDLTNEVRKHNNFAERIPKMEADIDNIKEDIKELKSR